jgi:hypothetical protein
MLRSNSIILCALLALLVIPICSYVFFERRCEMGEREFCQLLLGSKNRHIISMTLRVPENPSITVTDSQSVSYLTRMFRLATRVDAEQALFTRVSSYEATVSLYSGVSVKCAVWIPRQSQKKNITIIFPIGYSNDDSEYYLIPLQEPMPRPLSDLLLELAPAEEKYK